MEAAALVKTRLAIQTRRVRPGVRLVWEQAVAWVVPLVLALVIVGAVVILTRFLPRWVPDRPVKCSLRLIPPRFDLDLGKPELLHEKSPDEIDP